MGALGSPLRSRRRSRAEWERLLDEFVSSGATSREFCRRRRLNLGTFYWWRSELRDLRADSRATERSDVFVPLEVDAALSAPSDVADVVEVLVQGHERRARFTRDCPPELATAVLQALRMSSCS